MLIFISHRDGHEKLDIHISLAAILLPLTAIFSPLIGSYRISRYNYCYRKSMVVTSYASFDLLFFPVTFVIGQLFERACR